MPKNKHGLKWGSLYKQKNSRNWWIKYADETGKQCRESTGTPYLGKAINLVKQIEHRAKSAGKPTAELDTLVAEFHLSLQGRNRTHRKNIRGRLDHFLSARSITAPLQITGETVIQYVDKLRQEKALRTVPGYLTAVSTFSDYLCDRQILLSNPCRGVRKRLNKPHHTPPRYLNDHDLQALRMARKHGIFLPVAVALKTGMRMTEIRYMEWKDLLWREDGKHLIVIPRDKGKRGRTIPMHASLAKRLYPLRKKSGYVLPGQQGGSYGEKQWRTLLKPLQDAIPAFTLNHKGTGTAWHMLRHTFGYRMAAAGTPIPVLKEIMGHSDIKTTMIYARVAPNVWHDEIQNA